MVPKTGNIFFKNISEKTLWLQKSIYFLKKFSKKIYGA